MPEVIGIVSSQVIKLVSQWPGRDNAGLVGNRFRMIRIRIRVRLDRWGESFRMYCEPLQTFRLGRGCGRVRARAQYRVSRPVLELDSHWGGVGCKLEADQNRRRR